MHNQLVLHGPLPERIHVPVEVQQIMNLSDKLLQLGRRGLEVRFLRRQARQGAVLPIRRW